MISNALPQSLIDNPILSQWIAFAEPGRVRVGSGKVEIGQGILTALTQIAAEELDVRPEQINLVSGQTDVSPAEGFTSGSYSIAVGGGSIRLVCAEVRSLFVDRLAEALRCRADELSIEDGKFLRSGKDTGRDYWSMAGEIALERRATGTAPVKRPSTYKIVGKHWPRLDLPAKVAGAASSTTSRLGRSSTPACCASPGAARIWRRSTRARCARPPAAQSRSSATASSSRSPRTASLR
jgi:CO/xanthine dehydrogenase Mo-binding subunit